MSHELLTNDQMYRADALTIERGTPGIVLMENAGRGAAQVIMDTYPRQPAAILCGPGNNGGDGFVIARILQREGWPVRLFLLGDRNALKGDAADAAARWTGEALPLDDAIGLEERLVVDALFGAGLSRPIEGAPARLIEQLNAGAAKVVAIDVPSGIEGTTGRAGDVAVRADTTITFFRKKPAHVLMPGRMHCGGLHVLDIGISEDVLAEIGPELWENLPALWLDAFPFPRIDGHKYRRGHAVVVSGPLATGGAARLAARGSLRIGAGLVTIGCPPGALVGHASQLNAIMTTPFEDLGEILADSRKNVFALGPGNGIGEKTRVNVLAALEAGRPCVLDADALTSFADAPEHLFSSLSPACVLTPHEGEFARLFPDLRDGARIERAKEAATRAGCVVVLKGPDTVIAAPDGRVAVNTNAPPTLGTAGSGDVLAGFVLGLLAQSMPSFEAACAAVWLHGEAATVFGPGLIAEDLPETLPQALLNMDESVARNFAGVP